MKKKFLFIILLPFIFYFSSCKKEDNYETIYPKSYYPCYPGTWWKYLKNDSIIEYVNVSESYVLNSYWLDRANNKISEPKYVPMINSKPIYGYKRLRDDFPRVGESNFQYLEPFFSEKIGEVYFPGATWSSTHYGDFRAHHTVKERYFNGTDSVIVVEVHWEKGYDLLKKRYMRYTKNVGLTSSILVHTVTHDTLYKYILTDYFIGKK